MKKIYTKISMLMLMAAPFIHGCQKEEMMMSEDKISEQISYTWTKQFTPAETQVTWQFKDGKITVRQNENLACEGTYSIDCSLTKVKVKLKGFGGGYSFMNDTWQVISLDDKILVVTDLDKGIMEYEFVRKD